MPITIYKVQKSIRFLMIAGFFALPGVAFLKCSSSVRACDGDSKAASFARSLSQERLARLHAEMKALRQQDKSNLSAPKYGPPYGNPIPVEFQDIECRLIFPNRDTPIIRLEGCFDHFLDLRFYGIGEAKVAHPDEPELQPRIVLIWGELEQHEETLWTGPPVS